MLRDLRSRDRATSRASSKLWDRESRAAGSNERLSSFLVLNLDSETRLEESMLLACLANLSAPRNCVPDSDRDLDTRSRFLDREVLMSFAARLVLKLLES